MPRNGSKKSNKNAKRLPVLTNKLSDINKNNDINVNKHKNTNNNSGQNNSYKSENNIRNNNSNTTSPIKTTQRNKKEQKNIKIKKIFIKETFTTKRRRFNKINRYDANLTTSTVTSIPKHKLAAITTITDAAQTAAFKKNPLEKSLQQKQPPLSSNNVTQHKQSILKYFAKNFQSIKLDDITKEYYLDYKSTEQKRILNVKLNNDDDDDIGDVDVDNNSIINNCNSINKNNNKSSPSNSIKQSDICELETVRKSINFTTKTETRTSYRISVPSAVAASSAAISTLSPLSPKSNSIILSSISSLYPIVIDTAKTLLQQQPNNNNYNHNNNVSKEQQQQVKEKSLIKNQINTKLNSNFNNNNNNNNNYNNNNNDDDAVKYYQATVNDTLEEQEQQQQYKSQQNKQHKQSTQTTPTEAFKRKQSQEVKARLATLRTRKRVLQQQRQEQEHLLSRTAHKGQKSKTLTASSSGLSTSAAAEAVENCTEDNNSRLLSYAGKGFRKKVPAILDDATLNLIETLNDNEIKKPNNKRRRNTTAALLSIASLHQPRPKRFAISPDKSTPSVTTGAGIAKAAKATTPYLIDNIEHKQTFATNGQFVKPLPIETTANTNSKKRARIMSLYERPFQTTNDGRGSLISNGYMTSSRSSASSGGVGGATLIISDVNDTQEMANQYYLSGSSGTGGIASSSTSSLVVGNGSSVMNHVPTMGTLCNIGNTCYLNSVVYTLRFAPHFLHNLHHLLTDLNALQQNIARASAKSSSLGRGMSSMQMENARSWSSKDLASMEQYGSSGIIAGGGTSIIATTVNTQVLTQKSCHQLLSEKLHELYQSLHRNEINESTEPHHPDTLLHAIQDVSSIFEGNQQQDAHEFLMCLLNSIRETSQTLIKAIAECPDVILNGFIPNSDEQERDIIKNHTEGIGGGGFSSAGNASNNSNTSLASTTLSSLTSSKTSSFFSRKSKRKDDSKSSKTSRLQSPLKDALISGGGSNTGPTTTANSLFYLNTNDLNSATSSSSTSPASVIAMAAGSVSANTTATTKGTVVTSTSSSSPHLSEVGFGDETDASTAVALLLKDKQRLECKIRELGLDFFNEDFEGITVSTTKCLSCETVTEQKETMIDIAVPVPQAGYESNEFMDKPSSFIQNSCITREYFRNENKYRCEQCCGYTEAIRSISYEVLPRLLIIQLSRFSGGMEKINSYIPTSFTLQCFCSKCCELNDANKLHIYKLYSVITHVGATMSVGHYIAYTCSLDWANEYINCPKEQRRRASQERNLSKQTTLAAAAVNGSTLLVGTNSTGGQSATSSSSSNSFMKMKMKFGRSKASSSGDMSKNVKQLNGLNSNSNNSSSKSITNGIGKLTMNNAAGSVTAQCPITCQSVNCCAMRITAQQQLQYQPANNSTSDFSEESSQYSNGSGYNTPAFYNNNIHHAYTNTNTTNSNTNTNANNTSASTNTSGYGSTGRGSTKASYATQNNCNEPFWYMCDDDKIKAMTQREFEDLLSPARKITITPYLLFYARYNLQSTPPKSATASTSSSGLITSSSPQTSWSNESLQSTGGGNSTAHNSSGIRM